MPQPTNHSLDQNPSGFPPKTVATDTRNGTLLMTGCWIGTSLLFAAAVFVCSRLMTVSATSAAAVALFSAVYSLLSYRVWDAVAARLGSYSERVRRELEEQAVEVARRLKLDERRQEILKDVTKSSSIESACSILMRHLVPSIRLGFAGVFGVKEGEVELQAWRGLSRKPNTELTLDASFQFRASRSATVRVDVQTLSRSELIQGLRIRSNAHIGDLALFRLGEPHESHWLVAYSQKLLGDDFIDTDERIDWLRCLLDAVHAHLLRLNSDADAAQELATKRFRERVNAVGGSVERPGDIGIGIQQILEFLRTTLGIDRIALHAVQGNDQNINVIAEAGAALPPNVRRSLIAQEASLRSHAPAEGVALLEGDRLKLLGIETLIGTAALSTVTWRDRPFAVLIASQRGRWNPAETSASIVQCCATRIAELFDTAATLTHQQPAHDSEPDDGRLREEFLAKMSHELRTPVSGILGVADLALGTDLSAEQREYLSMVKSSSSSLMQMLNDVLDLSKIEAGGMRLEAIEFPLRKTVTEIVRSPAVAAHQKGVATCVRIAPDVPDQLIGDPLRLRQVITNLIGNAVKYTAEGEIVVQILVAERSPDDVALRFEVRDSGPGVPIEARERIFEKYEQTDVSDSRKYGGTGLGLPICKELVELMGGAIGVDQAEEGGSLFHFRAIFGIAPESEPEDVCDVERAAFIIADGHRTTAASLREMLSPLVGSVELARHADDAIDRLAVVQQRDAGQVILLIDAHLHQAGRVAAEARRRFADRALTVIALRAIGTTEPLGESAIETPDAVLLKPIDRSELFAAIDQVKQNEPTTLSPVEAFGMNETHDSPLNLLLAEDEKVNRLLAKRMLQSVGHNVHVVENGAQAVQAVAVQEFDLILMDLNMPEMDGVEATREIRDWEQQRRASPTPIVCLTASSFEHDRVRCLDAGMDGFCVKPITVDAIRQCVAEHCDRPVNQDAVGMLSQVLEDVRTRS